MGRFSGFAVCECDGGHTAENDPVAAGLNNAQVAERLVLSPCTANGHLTAIYTKLKIPSRSAAIRFALDHGLT